MNVATKIMQLSLTGETANQLRAFTEARNGSIHNQADAAIRRGIKELVADAPEAFRQRYHAILKGKPE